MKRQKQRGNDLKEVASSAAKNKQKIQAYNTACHSWGEEESVRCKGFFIRAISNDKTIITTNIAVAIWYGVSK